MTQLEIAKSDMISPLLKQLADIENTPISVLRNSVKSGTVVIPANKQRNIKKPCAIGAGLSTKINANIGTSPDCINLKNELKKLRIAVEYGADTVMDLSIGGNLSEIRRAVIANSPVPVGTVPIYEIAVTSQNRKKNLLKFDIDDIITTLELQAKAGVDFFTIHAGVTKRSLKALKSQKRLLGIVSRGGAILARWMNYHKKENPFFEHFDKIIDIAYDYDITLSLGDGLRPGSIFDATDSGQIEELKILGELAKRAYRRNVQVMIEGPGHVPFDQIKRNILLEKKYCNKAPFYVLGPLVTDIASGYDHISSAIGATAAASYGADYICYVTPSEHLSLPSINDVKEGVIASKIAAHAADIVKKIPSAIEHDMKMAKARMKRDWKKQIALSIDPVKAKKYRMSSSPGESDVCTMCGKYCSIKLNEQCK